MKTAIDEPGVYIIQNVVDGKMYVGSAVSLKKRKSQHWTNLRRNNHKNSHLQRAWNKYGAECFVFHPLINCDKEALVLTEQMYMDFFRSYNRNLGYNKAPRAGNTLGFKHTEETREKIRVANVGKKKGPPSEAAKKKLSDAHKGKVLAPEHREKLRVAHAGKKHTEATKKKMSDAHKGRALSPEAREKLRVANAGKKLTEATKKKMSDAKKERHQQKLITERTSTAQPLIWT